MTDTPLTTPSPTTGYDHPDPKAGFEVMFRLLTEQRDLYRQLKALSDQQSASIREGSTEQLLSVLSQRQNVIDSLSRLNAELAPYRDRWSQISDSVGDARKTQLRDMLDEIEQLLQQVVAQDEKDREDLKLAQQQIGTQLTRVGQAGRVLKAYAPSGSEARPAVFTDRQG
ncbi:MAG: hypothetical protein Kow00105_19820 [Phycisphaeraceae bacterium]